MAYKQTPGRGNSPKTGNGLPSPLRQEDKKMVDAKMEYNDKYSKKVK